MNPAQSSDGSRLTVYGLWCGFRFEATFGFRLKISDLGCSISGSDISKHGRVAFVVCELRTITLLHSPIVFMVPVRGS